MSNIQIGNAPCSWGTLEFEGIAQQPITYAQMLDELAATGYTGTELGDWGFMPTDPIRLADELRHRSLAMTGAFVGVALKHADAHAAGEEAAVRTARLIADVAERLDTSTSPFLVLADDNGTDPVRTRHAGRITPEMGLDDDEWRTCARGAERIAQAVRDVTGLRTVFHHHCAGFVETPDEIARLLDRTDPDLLGLVFDTGHFVYGTGGVAISALDGLKRFADRIWYVHFKDCHPDVAARARAANWDYFRAVEEGVFCELGEGQIDFAAILAWLREIGYAKYITVEQDVLPGMGTPKESAQRNRDYLRRIGV